MIKSLTYGFDEKQYCEFGGTAKKCEDWLKEHHPGLHEKLYSEGLSSPLPSLTDKYYAAGEQKNNPLT
jgi:hypothetical protein